MNGKNVCEAEMANFQIDDSSVFLSGPWLNAAVNEFLKRSYWFPSGLIRKQEGLEFGFSKLCLVFGGNYFFLFFECGGWHFVVTPFTKDDCFRTFLSSCSRKLKLIQARALASSNLSRLLLSQAQTYPGPSSSQKRKKHSWASIFCSGTFLFNLKSSRPCRSIFSSSTKAWNSATFFLLECKKSSFSSSINFSLFAIYFGAKFSGKRHGLQKSAHASDLLFVGSSPSFGSH